jgi:CheY-like chemotaxis protein
MTKRILVVDDNPTNLKLACDLLESDGYAVERAVDAQEARAVIAAKHVDLICMDIELPGTDGLSLTRSLKADEATSAIPVVALTAFAMKGDDQRAFDAGCIGYITKPIDTRKFGALVAAYILHGNGG